jgi:glycosyltransferase
MKITVVTVAYNSAATIADTLRSVAAQAHPDIEHIVIDGASKDDTLEIVRREGAHVARVVSEPDKGIYDAMNKGLALATGHFVGFLNADDLFADAQAVSRIAQAAARPGTDAVFGDLVYVREQDTDKVVRWWKSGEFDRSRLGFGWMPPHPTFYVRRGLTAQTGGGFDAGFRISADYEFMLRCLSQPNVRVEYVPQVLVRMRTGGASNRSLKAVLRKMREDIEALRRNRVGGLFTLACKSLRKLPQFLGTSRA